MNPLDLSDDSRTRYGFSDTIFFVTRGELEQHRDEIPRLQERYLAWAAEYAAQHADSLAMRSGEADRVLIAVKHDIVHLQSALHILKDGSLTLDGRTRDRLLLTLTAAGYELLRAGCDRFANNQRFEQEAAVFTAAQAAKWRATAEEAFHCVYAALPAALRVSVARLAVFGGMPFEPDDARIITETNEAHLMQLLNTGLLRRCNEVVRLRCTWAQQSRQRIGLLARFRRIVPARRRRALRGGRWTSPTRRFENSIRPRRRWVLPGRRWTSRIRGFGGDVRSRPQRRWVLRGRQWTGRPEGFDRAVRLRRRWVLRGRRWGVQTWGFHSVVRPRRRWGQRIRRRTSQIHSFDGAFRLSWSVVQELAQRAYQQLDDTERAQCEQRYAAHFARRLAEEPFSDAIARHIERGQGYAVRYAMHREVIIYADRCYRRFWGRQEYERLADWLAQAVHSAEMLGDDASAAVACERLGDVCLKQSECVTPERRAGWYDQAEAHYKRALENYPGAAPDTRARAELGLGAVAERRGQWDVAEAHYQSVLEQYPHAPSSILDSARADLERVRQKQSQE